MADNVAITEGTGTSIAADEISGAKYQRVKLIHGADGSNDGDVSSINGLPVAQQDFSASGTITANAQTVTLSSLPGSGTVAVQVTGTFVANLVTEISVDGTNFSVVPVKDNYETNTTSNITSTGIYFANAAGIKAFRIRCSSYTSGTAAVSIRATAGSSVINHLVASVKASVQDNDEQPIDSATASPAGTERGLIVRNIPSGTQPISVASLPLPTGGATSAKQDTEIGLLTTIDADTGTIAGAVSGSEMQVDVVGALPAGTNNIGDVDVASLPSLPAGTNAIGKLAANDGVDIGDVTINNASIPVTGTFWQATQPVSLASVPSHAVTNAGTFAVQESGAALTALQLIDDTVATTAAAIPTKGLAVSGTDGTNARVLKTDTSGELQVDVLTLPANASVNVAQMNGTSVSMGNGVSGTGVQRVTIASDSTGQIIANGGVAHDGVDSGNPVKVGAKAMSALSTATMVAAADRADNVADLDGALIIRSGRPLGDMLSERVSDTAGTSAAFTNFAATASTRNYVTAITVFNSSATAGYVDFRDGTAGSILYTVPLPAGGGAVVTMGGEPLFRTSANTALAYDVSAALSTVYISISGFKSKV